VDRQQLRRHDRSTRRPQHRAHERRHALQPRASGAAVRYRAQRGIPRDPEEYIINGPWREVADVYMWNGDRFAYVRRTYTSPEFRFQAVQDGDSEAAFGRFAEAEAFYRSVRDNNALLPWSPDLALAWQETSRAQLTGIFPPRLHPPCPTPPSSRRWWPIRSFGWSCSMPRPGA
jgi:hypothetical protein